MAFGAFGEIQSHKFPDFGFIVFILGERRWRHTRQYPVWLTGHFYGNLQLKVSCPLIEAMSGIAPSPVSLQAAQEQLPSLVRDWMKLESEVQTLSAAVSEKRKRIKVLRGMITTIMQGGQISQLNTSAGALVNKTTTTKAPLTKKYISATLTEFFNGDKEMAEKCAAFLDEHRPLKESSKLKIEPI